MDPEHGFEIVVAPGDGVPYKARQAVLEGMQAEQLALVRRTGLEARALERVRRAYVESVRAYMGASRYERYRAMLAELKAEQAEALHPPRGPRMSQAELDELRRKRRRGSLAVLRKLGIRASRMESLSRRAQADSERATAAATLRGRKPPTFVRPSDVPLEVRANKGNPWTIYTPPFPGSSTWYAWYPAGSFYKGTVNYTLKDTGQVGHMSRVSIHDASDIDICNAYYRTSVGNWYQMPKAGRVEVWIEALLDRGRHKCELDDEVGWSDSTVRHWSYLSAQTWGSPNGILRTAEMSSWYEQGFTGGYWSIQFLTPGQTYWAHLFSDVSYAKNDWVYVDVGAYSRNYVYTNDVEVTSRVDFRWTFSRVFVDAIS